MVGSAWVVDDRTNERFPIWTRGNVGEVFPAVVSPLTWSLFGASAEHGWRDAFADFGALAPKDYGDVDPAVVGVFGGYCYLNVSAHRVLAVRTPGLTPADMDRSIFGESDAPPYEATPGDKRLGATVRITGRVARTLFAKGTPHLDADKAAVAAWLASRPDPAAATDDELRATIDQYRSMFRHLFRHHLLTTLQATVPVGLLTDLCSTKLGDPGLVVRLLGGIGDVESAEPARRLWVLGRVAESTPAVTAAFDAGLDGLLERLDATPGAAPFLAELEAFRAEFGCRGPNEWEGSSPTWGTDAALVLAAVDAMRRADPAHDPERQRALLEADRAAALAVARDGLKGAARRQFDLALRSATVFSQGRERSKTTVIRGLHGYRLAVRELARRATGRHDDVFLVTADELDAYLAEPGAFAATIAERRARHEELAALDPPFVFVGTQPDPSTWTPRAGLPDDKAAPGTVLSGIAGCPGIARGRARVVLDPADPRGLGPGDVLVAPITDPAWTPLFLPAEAVVVDVGAQMSHAVIVSRELGIPCAVSVVGATRSIPDGALIEVDGTRGTVTVLEG